MNWLTKIILLLQLSIVNSSYDVIILGAGMAGLGAGKELHSNGVTNFLILEGNDYIGGRVKNVEFENASIPLGAGWVHLTDQNHTIYRLLKQYDMDLYRDTYNLSQILFWNRKDAKLYPTADVLKKYNDLETKLGVMDTKVENRIESGRADMDLSSGLRWVGWNADTLLDVAVEYFMFDFENGVPPSVISATAYGYTGAGEDYIVNDRRGYMYPILQEIQPFRNKTLLNHTVTRIKRNGNKNYTIYTNNGKEWNAKYVIVTFSSGVLNSDIVKFEPDLPDWKKESLALVPMCYYCKIFAQFSEKFWNDTIYFIVASDIREQYFHWQDVSNIFNITNVLVATLTGQTCKDSGVFTDDEIADQIFNVLKDIYPNATKPTKIIRNTFNHDPKFMGSYSYQTPGISEIDYRSLEHPVQQNLWFAGEYLGRYDYGYVHGAYEIGQNVSKQIMDCMKNNKCPNVQPQIQSKACPNDSHSSSVNYQASFLMIKFFFIVFFVYNYYFF